MTERERSDGELLADPTPAGFGCFYDRHVRAVTAFVGARTRRPEITFDLVAETFARALERSSQYDPARGPAIAWLLGIARHLIIDAARRGRVEAESRARLGMAAIELDDGQLAIVDAWARADLREALAGIPAEQREAVIRRVVLDEPYPALAADLGCSERVVRKRVSRGLTNLRAGLEERR
jgi:RNA polymerase sigma-70 factor (ECF subfamily)